MLPRNGDEGVTIDERGVNHEQTWGVNYHCLSTASGPWNLSLGGETGRLEANERGADQAQTVNADYHTSHMPDGLPCLSSGGGGGVEGSLGATNQMWLGDIIVSALSTFDTSQNHVTNLLDKGQLTLSGDSDSHTFHEEKESSGEDEVLGFLYHTRSQVEDFDSDDTQDERVVTDAIFYCL